MKQIYCCGFARQFIDSIAPEALLTPDRQSRCFEESRKHACLEKKAKLKRFRGRPMTEVEWMAATDPRPMLDFIGAQASQRKLRIFAFACCRSVWEQLTREIQHEAIQVAERHADGNATDKELGIVVSAVHRQRRKHNTLDKAVYEDASWSICCSARSRIPCGKG